MKRKDEKKNTHKIQKIYYEIYYKLLQNGKKLQQQQNT